VQLFPLCENIFMPFRVLFRITNDVTPSVFDSAAREHHGGAFVLQTATLPHLGMALADYSIVHAALSSATFPLRTSIAPSIRGKYLGLSGAATVDIWNWDGRSLTLRGLPVDATPEMVLAILRERHSREPEHVLVFSEQGLETTLCALVLYGASRDAAESYDGLCRQEWGPGGIVVCEGNVVVPQVAEDFSSDGRGEGLARCSVADLMRALGAVADGTKSVKQDPHGNLYIY